MKKVSIGAATIAASFALASVASAAADAPAYCQERPAPTIVAPADGLGAQCQSAVTKNSQKFVKTLVKTRGKCVLKGDHTACPSTKDDEKIAKAAIKAQESIAAACSDTSGLGSSYSGEEGSDVGSCTLSQHHGTGEVFVGLTHGGTAESILSNEARRDCANALAKEAEKALPAMLKIIDKCIEGKIKDGITNNLGAECVGGVSGGAYNGPSDVDTDDALTSAMDKSLAKVNGACATLPAATIESLWACPGATTAADLEACFRCSTADAALEIVAHQYAETGDLVPNGATGAIQAAVDAASSGDKLLIQSGTYSEGVLIPGAVCVGGSEVGDSCLGDTDCPGGACESPADDLSIVGCGAATDDRPRIIPPLLSPPARGFLAAGVDGLHFQALELTGWEDDGIFATNADGISFRDLLGNGDDLATPAVDSISIYAVFPVVSRNVVVEGTEVINVRDAGIYVGQSDGITVRYNDVRANVTGVEIENSLNADVYGNVATGNTGGLLSFKLPGPPIQTHGFHKFYDNATFSNDIPNFAIPGSTVSAVLPGTGVMIISDDDSRFSYNLVTENDTFGFAILDQNIINTLTGEQVFDPVSADQDVERLRFSFNFVRENGKNPDPSVTGDPNTFGNFVYALSTGDNGNCFESTGQLAPTPNFSLTGEFPECP